MTKEELEKEAEEKYSEVDREFITCQDEGEVFNIGYVLGAEPREKQLTKAIELLKATLLMAKVEGLKGRYETVDEIEQFLKEIEK